VSAVAGTEIYFLEEQCEACGAPSCRAVGKQRSEWPLPDRPRLRYFEEEDLDSELIGVYDELRRINEQLTDLTQSATDAIVATNVSGKIKVFNRSAERIFGFKAHEVLGRSIRMLVPDEILEANLLARSEPPHVVFIEAVRILEAHRVVADPLVPIPAPDEPTGIPVGPLPVGGIHIPEPSPIHRLRGPHVLVPVPLEHELRGLRAIPDLPKRRVRDPSESLFPTPAHFNGRVEVVNLTQVPRPGAFRALDGSLSGEVRNRHDALFRAGGGCGYDGHRRGRGRTEGERKDEVEDQGRGRGAHQGEGRPAAGSGQADGLRETNGGPEEASKERNGGRSASGA